MDWTPFEIAPGIRVGDESLPFLIAGPCVIESAELALEVARVVRGIADRHGVKAIFKASFDKANRSSVASYRGPGLEQGLEALAAVKAETGLAVLTDVHHPEQAAPAAEVADILQVPAFLCRQTDLLLACGASGASVNVKKGQFMAPEDMRNAVEKIRSTGNQRVTLTERGASFGYHNLVVDMRSLPVMRRFAPVVFDVTHSLQLPGGLGHSTGGAREFHPYLARAAAAVGVDGFFVEVHPRPAEALSDATTQLEPAELERLVAQVTAIARTLAEVGP
ncbi:MAG: 3-deoxy-8-phosphooctulonate synthase [Thermoanaerobaculales bacterium]|jgi:2-dehydro-3-deoxyphosphooctonate aldolase (KDO 8-P synthase)|nr:3-deoxy-8-phosphooctulonate synthase [Thermoanaerobaculales bacterium]